MVVRGRRVLAGVLAALLAAPSCAVAVSTATLQAEQVAASVLGGQPCGGDFQLLWRDLRSYGPNVIGEATLGSCTASIDSHFARASRRYHWAGWVDYCSDVLHEESHLSPFNLIDTFNDPGSVSYYIVTEQPACIAFARRHRPSSLI